MLAAKGIISMSWGSFWHKCSSYLIHLFCLTSDGTAIAVESVGVAETATQTHSCPLYILVHTQPAEALLFQRWTTARLHSCLLPKQPVTRLTEKAGGKKWKHSMSHCQLKHLCLEQLSGCEKMCQQKHCQEAVFTPPCYFQFRFSRRHFLFAFLFSVNGHVCKIPHLIQRLLQELECVFAVKASNIKV